MPPLSGSELDNNLENDNSQDRTKNCVKPRKTIIFKTGEPTYGPTYKSKNSDLTSGRINIFKLYIHRYIRLTPALAAGILFFETFSNRITNGPMHHMLYLGGSCTKYWWSALLYIQNYVNISQLCFAHSWYLTTDMQLFTLSPIVIYPLWKWKQKIIWPTLFLIVTSMTYNFVVFMVNDFSMRITDPKHQEQMEETYYPIYARMGVYLIGVLLANYLHSRKGEKMSIPVALVLFGWVVCILTSLLVIISVYTLYQPYSASTTLINSLYIALSRIVWGLALSWTIFCCNHGYAGPIDWFLSLPQWQPISRLSYTIYLVHYPIQVMLIASIKTSTFTDEIQTVYSFWGDFGFALCVATVWSLAFELPFINLEKVIFSLKKPKTTKSNENRVEQNRTENEVNS